MAACLHIDTAASPDYLVKQLAKCNPNLVGVLIRSGVALAGIGLVVDRTSTAIAEREFWKCVFSGVLASAVLHGAYCSSVVITGTP